MSYVPSQPSAVARKGELPLRRLSALADLGPEAALLLNGLNDTHDWPAGAELLNEQAAIQTPRFILSGWAARNRLLADGRRQIVQFVLPGDAIGLCHRPQPRALCSVAALTSVRTLSATPVQEAINARTEAGLALAEASHVASAFDESCLVDQIVRLGRQSAYERICHLILELHTRLMMVGLADPHRFRMPLTQEMLADATGLSIVHVNRILQQQRRDKLFELRNGWLTLLRPEMLLSIADYRPPALRPYK